jgi:hypothetical protein
MGGIIARKYLVERALEIKESNCKIGLFLIASPSLGSNYADFLSPIAKFMKHSQADALRFIENNRWLSDLNKEFRNLKESKHLDIKGKELIEDKFIVLKKFLLRKQVVSPLSGAQYFGEPIKIPLSDHFSIAKPESNKSIQHRYLIQFLSEVLEDQVQFVENNTNQDTIIEITFRNDEIFTNKVIKQNGIDSLKAISKDQDLKIIGHTTRTKSISVLTSKNGYANLKESMEKKMLSIAVGCEIEAFDLKFNSKTAIKERLRIQRPLEIPSAFFDVDPEGNVMVCRSTYIEGLYDEANYAKNILSPSRTQSLDSTQIYITQDDYKHLYIHSNFVTSGFEETTKISTNQTSDLLLLVFNIINQGECPDYVIKSIVNAHKSKIQYLIDESLFNEDGSCRINLNGAKKIKMISGNEFHDIWINSTES